MTSPPDQRNGRRVEIEAAHWASRFECGDLTPTERAAFAAWLERDSEHQACFARYEDFSNQLNNVLPALNRAGSPVATVDAAPRRRPMAWTLFSGVTAAILIVVALTLQPSPRPQATMGAERQTLELADGTRADLNQNTDVVIAMSDTHRRVTLTRGEAMFSVAKDPDRPFVVDTPAGLVRVTGTRFNVRTVAVGRLEVTVLEGSVEVEPRTKSTRSEPGAPPVPPLKLAPGQHVSITHDATEITVLEPQGIEDVVAWRDGGILFEGVPLGDALGRFSRYHRRPILVSPEAGAVRLGGRFRLDDLDGFLRGLEGALPVRVTREIEGEIRVTAR